MNAIAKIEISQSTVLNFNGKKILSVNYSTYDVDGKLIDVKLTKNFTTDDELIKKSTELETLLTSKLLGGVASV
ncbi:MAG: hypothetical protein ACRDA4_05665 [Filifactoraceae bacterium]